MLPIINAEQIQGIVTLVNSLLPEIDQRTPCGYLTYLEQGRNTELRAFTIKTGNIPNALLEARFIRNSGEKAYRLFAHPEHETSGQSADTDTEKYPGAIRCSQTRIISFSGLVAHADEVVSLLIAIKCKLLDLAKARSIALIADNLALFDQAYESLNG